VLDIRVNNNYNTTNTRGVKMNEPKYMTSQDMSVVDRVFSDIRREFPVKEAIDYEDKIRQIVNQKIWDVLATLQDVYNEEVDYVMDEMNSKHREAPEIEEER
jgi:hypothetical protein